MRYFPGGSCDRFSTTERAATPSPICASCHCIATGDTFGTMRNAFPSREKKPPSIRATVIDSSVPSSALVVSAVVSLLAAAAESAE